MPSDPKISAIVLTKNEQANIFRCLKSLTWCTEVIVIDDYSFDQTLSVAKKSGARTFQRKLAGNFAAQRNFGLTKASHNWVLFIDADEVVSQNLAKEIKSKLGKTTNVSGFFLKRKDHFMGKNLKFGETASVALLRLAKKTAGKWHRPIHETWQLKGETSQLENPLIHFPHQSISQFIKSINFYTDLEAKHRLLQEDPDRSAVVAEMLFFPPAKFVYNYIILLGFLDGIPGFIVALMMSLHSFLVRAKTYEILNQKK